MEEKEIRCDEKELEIIRGTSNLDDDQSLFAAEELESVKAKIYEKRYPEFTSKEVMPVSTDAGPGAETISFWMYDEIGMAAIVSNYATDLPNVAVLGKKTSIPVVSLGDSYGYSIQDIRAAQKAGRPLETHLAGAARRGIEAKANQLAWYGNEQYGLYGLLNHPNIPRFTLPADGTGSSTRFSAKTCDQILRDLDDFVGAVADLTNGVEIPDTLLIAEKTRRILAGKRVPDTQTTALKYFLENNPYIKKIVTVPELKGAGTGGLDMMAAYKYDPDKFTLEIPQPFEQFPVQPRGLAFVVPCHERFGGLLVRYPLSIIITEGV